MGEFIQTLTSFELYKRNQGWIARQVTFGALALIVTVAAWSLNQHYTGAVEQTTSAEGAVTTTQAGMIGRVVMPLVVLLVGWWVSFRAVQMPSFADFLISVEAEMSKVTWPTRGELVRASIVVILMIFFLAIVLFGFDLTWRFLLERVLHLK